MAMLERLQTDQSLARYAGWFIPLKIEVNGEQWGQWSSRYRHEGNNIPIIFVVRADGQQLFGKSGTLPGLELPLMIEQVLQQAGKIYNDQQLQLLKTSVDKAKQALASNDTATAVRELGKTAPLGPLGELGSYSEAAVAADGLTQKLIEQGRSALAAAKEKLAQPETQFEGALALAETRRLYVTLPPLKNEIVAASNEARKDSALRDLLKLAEQLDEARDLLGKPGGQRRALSTLRRITAENRGTPAAELAAEWLREHDPSGASAAPDAKTAPSKSRDIRTWTSDTGSTLEAALVGFGYAETTKAPYVELETREGKRMTVPYDRLSADSQALAKELVRKLREAGSRD